VASRASDSDVREVIESDSSISMRPFIAAASAIVDWIDGTCDSSNVLSTTQLRQIETWLAAHFYSRRDPGFLEKATDKARGVFQGQTAMHFDSTFWGQTAMEIDVSGCLTKRNNEMKTGMLAKVGLTWLGKPPSTQTDYVDRD